MHEPATCPTLDCMRPDRPRRSAAPAWATYALVSALGVACTSPPACEPEPPDPACPDLRFSEQLYDEWREVELPAVTQELGDAAYPACNEKGDCRPDLGGHGATDVWLLEGVAPEQAVIGFRHATRTPVVFVRRGLDPSTVPGLRAGDR